MYHGNGYTWGDVQGMTVDQLNRHAKRLYDHKMTEREAREQAELAARQRAKSGSR